MTPSVDQLIADIPHLASYGKAVRELENVLCDPRSTLIEVAESIEKDPALAAGWLRLGNSSWITSSEHCDWAARVNDLLCRSK